MAKLGLEARMTIQELARRGVSGRQIARTLEVTEGTVRYHRRRHKTGAVDGRSQQAFLASGWHGQIAGWLATCEAAEEAVNLVVLHAWLANNRFLLRYSVCISRSEAERHRTAKVGFRSSFRDWAAERTDHPREVIEAALAHVVQNKAEAAYARSTPTGETSMSGSHSPTK